jgi:D-alanine-D-alanine ligase-like ATP-grasp enzyme
LFSVASATGELIFGGGRCSYYPQNNATATTLANDKYLASRVLDHAGVTTLGGRYFFLHDRHRALRPPGHDREDAIAYLDEMGGRGFAKPLNGSRGDFAQVVDSDSVGAYLDEVARYYDAVLLQPIVDGDEYRVFVLGDEVLYCARKHPPDLVGDGVRSLRELLAEREQALRARGIAAVAADEPSLDRVLAAGERWTLPGRMNRSAGGRMAMQAPEDHSVAYALARRAVGALGLQLGAVDLFTGIAAAPAIRVIEVNANPSIRFLEDCGREDLILHIWHDTFARMGLLDV